MPQGEGGGGGSGIIPPIGYGPLGLEIGGFGIGLGGGFGLDLGVFGTVGFEGIPRAAKSKRAAHVFLSSPDPALRTLGFQLMRFIDQGGVLSTGNEADRRRLGSFVHQAVLALEAQGLPRGEAFRHISNTISYGTPIPVPKALSRGPETGPSSPSPNARGLDWFTRQLNKLPAAGFGAGMAAFEVTGQPEAPLIGYLVGQELKDVGTGLDSFARSFNRQPSQPQQNIPPTAAQPSQPQQFIPPTSPQPNYPNGPTDTVPTLQDCPECGFMNPRLRAQHDTLEDELRVEQRQNTDNQDSQRQQRIDDLRAQERLPADQRDIPREIQEKQQMLRDIAREARGGSTPVGSSGNPPTPTGGVPTLDYPPPQPLTYQPPPEVMTQRQPHDHNPNPNDANAVKFCVQCSSQAESLKFLNGEPSECSVVV